MYLSFLVFWKKCFMRECKKSIQNMHKSNYFKSADVSMLGHGCDISQFPQFYDKIKNKYHFLLRPFVVS